jgi:hypothetical protein
VHFGTEHLGKSHFGIDVSSRENFSTCPTSALLMFRQMDVSTQERFNLGTYRHSSTGAEMSVPKRPYCFARCQKFLVPKIPSAEKFPCRNIHLPERPQGQNVHVPKCSIDETSVQK